MKPSLILLCICLGLATLLGAIAANITTAAPGGSVRYFDAPVGGGHRIGLMLIPCTAGTSGRVVIGYDMFISSRFPPPGVSLPTAPSCP